ncbi:MAG TPA: energy transducer TonB [Saprospiraceae bacterium]|nr:energy transducer TonB [Saprospiraceae bacterium]
MNRHSANFTPSFKGTCLLITMLLFAFLSPSLSSQQISPSGKAGSEIQVSETLYYVYENGEFREKILSKAPEMVGGKDLMETLIKLNMRYPEKAKEMRLGGTVIVSVVIDETGKMDDVFISEGIGGGCNDEALRAVRLMDKMGFEPGELNGRPVTVKFDIPITFLPQ